MEAIKLSKGYALDFASKELRNDREVVLSAVKLDGRYLSDASEKLQDDTELVSIAVAQNGEALRYASDRLRNNKKVVLTAIKNTYSFVPIDYLPIGIDYMSKRLKKDPQIKRLISIRRRELNKKEKQQLKKNAEKTKKR